MSNRADRGATRRSTAGSRAGSGSIHGGILCTILDEVMAWALVGEDNWGVTARMAVDFQRPVQVGMPIHAEGWITRSRRRIVDTAGHIVDADDRCRARDRDRRLRRRRREAQAGPAERYAFKPAPTSTPAPDAAAPDR